jgi:hypothetical protein
MDELLVAREDIDALADAVDAGTVPAPDLLRALVTAIRSAVGEDDPVSVSVEVESVPEVFEAAFVPEPASNAARHVRVTVAKIGR